MSLSPETIEKIQKLSAEQQSSLIEQLDSKVLQADLAVKAEGVSITDLEQYKEHRDNMRGAFATDSIEEFHNFTKKQLDQFPAFPVFVNGPNMSAEAIIDFGDAKLPGHCRFTGSIKLERTALYKTLLSTINGERFTQRELAELLEEYQAHVQVIAETDEGKAPIDLPKALTAIRNMTVEKVRNTSSEQNSYSESASVLEKQQIQSAGLKPVAFSFTCKPYTDLIERTFLLRISPITRSNDVIFSLKVLTLEEIKEDIALEFKSLLVNGFADTGVTTYMGDYCPSR